MLIVKNVVMSVLLHGCETWPALNYHTDWSEVFQTNGLSLLCRCIWRDRCIKDSMRPLCKVPILISDWKEICMAGSNSKRLTGQRRDCFFSVLLGTLQRGSGMKAKGEPTKLGRQLCAKFSPPSTFSIHGSAQHKNNWLEKVDCYGTHLAGPAAPV